jgi:hypothetical protein
VDHDGGAGVRPGARVLLLMLAPLLATATAAAQEPSLERVRALYLRSVEDAAGIPPAEAEIERLRGPVADPAVRALLDAYAGALLTLRARHGGSPRTRLRHLREGFAALDSVVAARPLMVEPRYLRLMSGYHLPAVFGRREEVREDFRKLAELLPSERGRTDPHLYEAVARFVIERGDLPPERREVLAATLETDGG